MKSKKINDPVIYKNNQDFLIFEDSTMDKIQFSDCNDTINGICHENGTLNECINMCGDSENCGIGYYIETPTKSICAPLNTNIFSDFNPTFKIRNTNIYPELEDSKSTLFVNTSLYSFPPNQTNSIFYYDSLVLKQDEKTMGGILPMVEFQGSNDISTIMQILPYQIQGHYNEEKVPISYMKNVIIRIPNTSYILTKNNNNKLEWSIKLFSPNESINLFQIIPVIENDRTENETMYYGAKFYIKHNHYENCYVNKSNEFMTSTKSIDKLENEGMKTIFTFSSMMYGYYCNEGSCVKVNLSEATQERHIAKYNDKIMFRDKNCFNMCKEDINKHNILMIVMVSLIVLICCIIILKLLF